MKKLIFLVLLTAAAAFMSSCGSAPPPVHRACRIEKYKDKIIKGTMVRMSGNMLGGSSHERILELNPVQTVPGRATGYQLHAVYEGSGYLFVEAGESMILDIDGKKVKLKGNGSSSFRKFLANGRVRERSIYPITIDLLNSIADAQKVKVLLNGSMDSTVHTFSPNNFKAFIRFVELAAGKRKKKTPDTQDVDFNML